MNDLHDYPRLVPLKVVGDNRRELREALDTTLIRHLPSGTAVEITSRESARGRYVAFTATFLAASREQLIAMYSELHRCDAVRFLL